MNGKLGRRDFIKAGGLSLFSGGSLLRSEQPRRSGKENDRLVRDRSAVKFTRDGLDMTPLEYSALLNDISSSDGISTDNYSLGGDVRKLEETFAELTGKEDGIFMPTGTLANHLAVRKLSGKNKRAIVQGESHIYNDSGDCVQNLSGINLIPLNNGKVGFTLEDVKSVLKWSEKGRVKTGIGCIVIESPVRRITNRMFDLFEIRKISGFAKEKGIKMHLDGARLFNASAHSGVPPAEICALFDTVYISLYKNFNAASGAILLGANKFIAGLYQERRMFGGGMPQVWPFASIALHYSRRFLSDYKSALKVFKDFSHILEYSGKFNVTIFEKGTNVFFLKPVIPVSSFADFRKKLFNMNIHIPPADNIKNGFFLKINTTLNRIKSFELAEKFISAVNF
jgi:threonine aldolase